MSNEASIDVTKVIFFDNNFINSLLSGAFGAELKIGNSALKHAIEPPFAPWRSPFSLMELLGVNTRKLAKPASFVGSVGRDELLEKVYGHFKSHYDCLRELDLSALRQRAENQHSRIVPELRHFWDCYMANLFCNWDESEWIRTALAFDAMHSDRAPMTSKDYRSMLIADCTVCAEGIISNLSKMRLAYSFWKECLAQNLRGPSNCERRRVFSAAHDLIKLDSHSDFLDCDIVHYATLGIASRDGNRRKVTCITNDTPEVVMMRIRVYKGFLAHVREVYSHGEGEIEISQKYESENNGDVLCFDQTGKLVRKINVFEEVQPLNFMK